MAMAEARIDVPEIYKQPYTPEDSLYRLAPGIGNSRIREGLTLFQKEGMKSPEAMRQLFSLFEALPTSEDEDSGLYRSREGVQPRHSWDQLEWAYTHQKELTSVQKESLILLPRFALDSLAHEQMVITAKGKKRILSPDAKGTAEEVFQAYDRYIAKVFDPELPDLHVPGKAAMGFVAIATALAACGPVSTPKTPEASPTKPAVTQPIQTETKIPTVTRTPTESMTPTETAVPRPEYYQGFERQADNFPYVQQTDIPLIAKDVLDHPMVINPGDVGQEPIQQFDEYGLEGVVILCKTEVNCAIRASFRTRDPGGGPDRWYLMWEIRNPGDDHSHVLITYLGGAISGDKDDVQFILDKIAKITRGGTLMGLKIATKRKQGRFDNPAVNEIVVNVPPADRQTLDEMRRTRTIPDDMSHIVVWLWDEFPMILA
jgi:hypothetical protein